MEVELAQSLNVKLDENVFDRIVQVQKRLGRKFKERRALDPSPHLSLTLKFTDASKTSVFTEKLESEFQGDQCWELTFSDFSISKIRVDTYTISVDDVNKTGSFMVIKEISSAK